ncbi:Aste57867_14612 [Aphanomyces stellatus]|uniref:Aste57867_14612 protein n=1 Tax=Aphanomyces stellatus TaxID=120398 RepID=A0A485L2T7_9STRA|nr:hypothetical protein As57867_014558 [Aphanomyces stellatus]VFT91431.1 Aste57867_14612 [Aphanomyces stellatus]
MTRETMTDEDSSKTDNLLDDSVKRTKRKSQLKQGLIALVFLAFFAVVLVPFLVSETKHSEFRGYDLIYRKLTEAKELNFVLFLSGMNTNSYGTSSSVHATPTTLHFYADISMATFMDALPQDVQKDPTSPVTPFRIQVAQNAVAVNSNTANMFAPLSSKILLTNGSISWYPFDTYDVAVELVVLTGVTPFVSVNATAVNAGIAVLSPRSFDWKYETTRTETDTGYYSLTVQVKRRFNLYAFLVFVGIWAVTFSVGYIGSCAVIWKRRPADNPIIYFSALFAVPTFRNTLPGRPPYGCLFDVACTYFSIAVIFTFLVLVSLEYMKKPKPAPPADVV